MAMKLHKIPRSWSNASSPLASPLPSPSTATSPSAMPDSPDGPLSPGCSKQAPKSSLADRGKALLLRLPSLSRSRSRGSSVIASSLDPSPRLAVSPLGLPTYASPETHASCSKISSEARTVSGAPGVRPDSHLEEIKRVFERFDSNSDGKISADELQHVLRALGDDITRKEAELIIDGADMDKDGYIDLQEFISLNMRGGSSVSGKAPADGLAAADELAAAFNMFDLDRSGCITPYDLHRVLSNLGNHTSTLEDCRRMISSVDRKGCGYVDFDDFKMMMNTGKTSIIA